MLYLCVAWVFDDKKNDIRKLEAWNHLSVEQSPLPSLNERDPVATGGSVWDVVEREGPEERIRMKVQESGFDGISKGGSVWVVWLKTNEGAYHYRSNNNFKKKTEVPNIID